MKINNKSKDMTILQASDFWDEHDFTEFNDVHEEKDIQFSLKRKKYIGIEMNLYNKIKNKAKKLHNSEETLVNQMLTQMLGT